MTLTSHEHFHAACEHRNPDRPPVDYLAHPETDRKLRAALGHGLKVMMHSCGAIRELIPLLIEAGVDILDPIQVTANGMVPAELKAAFGDRLVFHGGVDTQRILPFGTAADVVRHARATTAALGCNGGYIFAPSQILGPDIPVANILAMYGAMGECSAAQISAEESRK